MINAVIPPSLRVLVQRILTHTEQILRTDVRYLIKSGFWLSMGQVVSVVAGFGLSVTFGNLVSKEVFGVYKFIFSLAGLFATVTLTAMGTAVTQAVARGYDGALRQGMRTFFMWSIPSILAALGTAGYYLLQGNNEIGFSLLIVAVFSPLLSGFNLYSAYLKGKKDFARDTIYGFSLSVIPPVLMIGAMFLGARFSALVFVAIYYISMVFLSVFFHYRTVSFYKPSDNTDPSVTSYGKHLSLISVLGRVAAYVDKILIFHFLGAAPLAVYSFAIAPSQYVLRFNGIFRTLSLPKLAARDVPTLKQTLPRKIALHFAAAVAVTALYISLIPFFFHLLFPQYLDAIPYAQALGLTILAAPGVWLGQTLVAHMRKRELYIINTISPLFKMGLFATLIPLFGIWGAVGATLGSGLMGLVLGWWAFRKL